MGSYAFRAADSQRAFLRFVSDEVVAGRGGEVKEYSIAVEAFGRGADFDPRLDPIVRTQARKLRARLTAYYETEGRSAPIRIELRKGSYAPRFYYAEPPLSSPAQVSAVATVPASPPTLSGRRRRAIMAGAAAAVLCATAALYLVRDRQSKPVANEERASLAVMPLVNASGDPAEQILDDRLSAGLNDSLKLVPGLKVVTEGARSVLTGTFVKAGTKIRVKVQVSDAAHGTRFWSGSYQCDIGEIQMVVREITEEVSDVLHHP